MAILEISELIAVVDSFLAGHLEAGDLEAWAERYEMDEEVEYAVDGREVLAEAIFWLANPPINGALTVERVCEIRAWILGDAKVT